MNEEVEGVTVWLFGAGGAPSEKLIRIDYDPDDNAPPGSSFEGALTVLRDLAPTFVVSGYVMRLRHDLDHASVLLSLEPRKPTAVRNVGFEVSNSATATRLGH